MTNVIVNCEEGRRRGCQTFCCRLLVRLKPRERDPGQPDNLAKHCVDKDLETGYCVYLDRSCWQCGVWEDRPSVCRSYDCNHDPLLQVVLEEGFTSLVDLVTARPAAGAAPRQIPYSASGGDEEAPT